MSMRVIYSREPTLCVAEFRRVLIESGLGRIRPVDDEGRLQSLICGASLIITARLATERRALVGLARCVTDFSWCCYLSDLAVSASAKGLGIGRGLLEETRRQLGPGVSITLISVPDSTGFYEKAGMERLSDAFCYRRER
jgi:ribosomal protein S18 acetylase RimI-like enzyme